MESPCCSDDYVKVARNSPSDVASSISVSTGKTQLIFKVVQPMVGHRVGEFYLVHKFAVSKKKTNVRGKR
jgi:ribosomal protein S19